MSEDIPECGSEDALARVVVYRETGQCAICNGFCCRSYAGSYYPEDFGETREAIMKKVKEEIQAKHCVVDCWEGNPGVKENVEHGYFIRPMHVDGATPFDPSWGGICIYFVNNEGCFLSFDKRPTGCKALKSKEEGEGDCESSIRPKQDPALAWYPYWDDIDELLREFKQ